MKEPRIICDLILMSPRWKQQESRIRLIEEEDEENGTEFYVVERLGRDRIGGDRWSEWPDASDENRRVGRLMAAAYNAGRAAVQP